MTSWYHYLLLLGYHHVRDGGVVRSLQRQHLMQQVPQNVMLNVIFLYVGEIRELTDIDD